MYILFKHLCQENILAINYNYRKTEIKNGVKF